MSTVHRLAASIFVVLACSTLGADAAHATLSVLVDEIHGFRCRDQLAALWPDCELTALSAADYPMEMILASGVVSEDTEIQFTVPPGTVALYARFQVPAGTSQYPFISLYGPSGGFVGDHCLGHLHVESPSAGNYTLEYASWEQAPTPYEIGIGPHVLTAGRLAEYDVVLRPGPTIAAPADEVLARGEVVRRLENVLAAGGRLRAAGPPSTAWARRPATPSCRS